MEEEVITFNYSNPARLKVGDRVIVLPSYALAGKTGRIIDMKDAFVWSGRLKKTKKCMVTFEDHWNVEFMESSLAKL